MEISGKLVQRYHKLAFMEVAGESASTYQRMQAFTELSKSSNPSTYERRYVDEESQRSDITGYSPEFSYGFDQYSGNPVHEEIVKITDGELTGGDAVRAIIMVDFSKEGKTAGAHPAVKRNFSVIPDGEGDSTDAYTYSGSLKANGPKIDGMATSADGWKTITFTEESDSNS